jgi:hypothetical protein
LGIYQCKSRLAKNSIFAAMKKLIYSIIFVVLFSNLSGQNIYNKTGGVCFRFDDHQPAYKWRDLNALFNKYGYKFNLALNPERILTDTAAYNALREVMASGHELMEHTPSHTTAQISFSTAHKEDTLWFRGKKGIDHITLATGKVCLEVDTFYTENYTGEGKVNVYGSTIISVSPGEFKDLSSPVNYTNLYLPSKKFLGTWNSLRNKNPNDPDTIILQNYWQENVALDTVLGVPYHRLTVNDIKMTNDALTLLTERSLYIYDSLGFTRPKSWIQPGGSFAQLNKEEANDFLGAKYGFTAAATYVEPSLKMYNEVDSLHNKRFAIQNPDFSDENNTLEAMITSIADNSARHANSYTLSHLNPKLAWANYINRMDSLLAWIKDNNIPVRRFNEWATIMFDSTPNPYTNVIPEFYRDLNKNGIPDGVVIGSGTLDSNNGVARSQNIGLSRTANGSFFAINSLGGFEKGWNRFSVYTKGPGAKDSVRIGIGFPEIPNSQMYFNLAANTPDWTEVSTMVYLDPKATRMTFQISASRNIPTGSVQISGVQLRKHSTIKIKPSSTSITTQHFYNDIPADAYVSDSAYKNTEFTTQIISPAKSLQVSINSTNNTLIVKKPSLFWVGKDSVLIKASNGDNTTDSNYLYFEATYPTLCIGSSLVLKGNARYGTGYKWYVNPTPTVADSVTVTPTIGTWYKVEYTDLGSNPVVDSIFIGVDTQSPEINFATDTILCIGNNANLTITDVGTIRWLDGDGNLLQQGNTYTINPVTTASAKKIYVENRIKSCVIKQSVNIRANQIKVITQPLLYKEFIQGKATSTGFGVKIPAGVKMILLNTPINTFTILLQDSVSYTAPSSFRGADSAVYLITDSVCSFDTLILKVVVQKNLATQQLQAANITVYPNPANNELFISAENASIAHIYTIVGKQVLQQNIANGENKLSIAHLAKGVYLLQLETETGTVTGRFVKE